MAAQPCEPLCCRLGFCCMQARLHREYHLPAGWPLKHQVLCQALCYLGTSKSLLGPSREIANCLTGACKQRPAEGWESSTGESHSQHEQCAVRVGGKRVNDCQPPLRMCCPCYIQLISSSEYSKPLGLLWLGENEGFSLPLHECAYAWHLEEPGYVKITLSSFFWWWLVITE